MKELSNIIDKSMRLSNTMKLAAYFRKEHKDLCDSAKESVKDGVCISVIVSCTIDEILESEAITLDEDQRHYCMCTLEKLIQPKPNWK